MYSPNSTASLFDNNRLSPIPTKIERSNLPSPKFLYGYTGHVPEDNSEDHYVVKKVTKTPIVGHCGWHVGKVNGKLGKSIVHPAPISLPVIDTYTNTNNYNMSSTVTSNSYNDTFPKHNNQVDHNSTDNHSHKNNKLYINTDCSNSNTSLFSPKRYYSNNTDTKLILKEIFAKVETFSSAYFIPKEQLYKVLHNFKETLLCRFPTTATARAKIKSCFPDSIGYNECSIQNFKNSLLHLSFSLHEDDFTLLCYAFQSKVQRDYVRYHDFLLVIMPEVKYI